jgi:hypothetical protein
MSAYREPAVNMYDQQQPIASRGRFDLISIERKGNGWAAQVKCEMKTCRYISRDGTYWFNDLSGEQVEAGCSLDRLLTDRIEYLRVKAAVDR